MKRRLLIAWAVLFAASVLNEADMQERLRCAYAILRGREVAYRLHIKGGLTVHGNGGRFVDCEIEA